jgi:hypothetical protein
MGQITRTFPNFLLPNGTVEIQGQQEDPNPTLAGDLDVSTQSIVSSNDGDINITPDGTGSIVLDGLSWPQSDGTANQLISTDGAGNLVFTDNTITIRDTSSTTDTVALGEILTIQGTNGISASVTNNTITIDGANINSYTDSDVDTHLNTGSAVNGQVLSWNGSDYAWTLQAAAYTDSDVDTHLNTGSATSSQYLTWTGTDYAWAPPPSTPNPYTDSDVDTHLNTSSAGLNEVLTWDGSDYTWTATSNTLGGLTDVNTSTIDNGYLVYSAVAGSHNIQTLNIVHDTTPTLGGDLDTDSNSITGGLKLSDNGIIESFLTHSGVNSTIGLSALVSHSLFISSATNNKTLNITNLSLSASQGTNITVIWQQGSTPFMITALNINSTSATINWQGGSTPSGTANGVDVISFSIYYTGSSYVVTGQSVSFS